MCGCRRRFQKWALRNGGLGLGTKVSAELQYGRKSRSYERAMVYTNILRCDCMCMIGEQTTLGTDGIAFTTTPAQVQSEMVALTHQRS